MEQFNQVIAFGEDESIQKKWQAFAKRINFEIWDYNNVLRQINIFTIKPFKRAIFNN